MSDQEQKEQGKVVKVGLEQLGNDTPIFMKYILRVFAFICGVWALLPQDLIALPEHTINSINRWIPIVNAILLFGIKFFGWAPKDNPDQTT